MLGVTAVWPPNVAVKAEFLWSKTGFYMLGLEAVLQPRLSISLHSIDAIIQRLRSFFST